MTHASPNRNRAGPENARSELETGLYVVATPIGNLGDMTDRARSVLAAADHLLCEDKRVTARLLAAYGIRAKHLSPYHDHNGETVRPKVLNWLAEGRRVALVSDAGTPLISDPGYKLVESAQESGFSVFPVPGASALTAALCIAGLPTDRVLFMGFAPAKGGARRTWFEGVRSLMGTLVYYESTRRLSASLEDAAHVLGHRDASVCREMTKRFEEVVKNDLKTLASIFSASAPPKGECVVVIGPPKSDPGHTTGIETERLLEALIGPLGVKAAAAIAADLTGQKKQLLYKQAQVIKDRTA